MRDGKRQSEWVIRLKAAILLEAAMLFAVVMIWAEDGRFAEQGTVAASGSNIQWVDFNVSYEALCRAYEYDVDTYGTKTHLNWIELLSYVAAKCGGDFGVGAVEDIRAIAEKIKSGETTMEEAAKDMKYFSYYKEAYTAVLGGLVGEYEIQESPGGDYVKKYGLKGFSPIAKGFEYSDYDDFGVARSYGYHRQHLGHDMMGQVGTPT